MSAVLETLPSVRGAATAAAAAAAVFASNESADEELKRNLLSDDNNDVESPEIFVCAANASERRESVFESVSCLFLASTSLASAFQHSPLAAVAAVVRTPAEG